VCDGPDVLEAANLDPKNLGRAVFGREEFCPEGIPRGETVAFELGWADLGRGEEE